MRHARGEVFGVHRHLLLNVAAATGIATAATFASLIDISADGQAPLAPVWPHTAIIGAAGAWLAWRALRRALFITSYGIESRDFLTNPTLAWADIDTVECESRWWGTQWRVRPMKPASLWFTLPRSHDAKLADDVASARLVASRVDHPVVHTQGRLGKRPALLLLPVGIAAVSAAVLRGANSDVAEIDARERRMVRTTAEALTWEVRDVKDDDEGGGTHQETWGLVQFTPADEDPISVEMGRGGRWARPTGTFVVFYDRDDPTDVDFVGRPKRASRLEDAAQRHGWSLVGLVVAASILVWFGVRELTQRHERRRST